MGFSDILQTILNWFFGTKEAEELARSEQAQTEEQPTASNPNNVEGTQMRKSVFNVMVAGERDASQIESIKSQMRYKDGIGIYPYTITSDAWMYTITKPAEPYFSQYGTQYSACQKHK